MTTTTASTAIMHTVGGPHVSGEGSHSSLALRQSCSVFWLHIAVHATLGHISGLTLARLISDVFVCVTRISLWMQRDRERERERQTEEDREREKDKERERGRERERD